MNVTDRIKELVAELFTEAKKGGKKAGNLPGPLIGYLMNKGVIAKPGSKKWKAKRKAGKGKVGSKSSFKKRLLKTDRVSNMLRKKAVKETDKGEILWQAGRHAEREKAVKKSKAMIKASRNVRYGRKK